MRGRSAAAIAIAAVILFARDHHAGAQSRFAPRANTSQEEEALQLLEDGLYVSARSKAEEVLRRDPRSIAGHYVLGRAFFDAEGSLARAMFHLGRARELHEEENPVHFTSPFHQELLYQTARLAGQMELHEFQLELLGYHDHLYDPDLVAERAWPLMKLGRMREAREVAELAAGSPNMWQRSAGLNALCAVEGEARTRQPYFDACQRALADARIAASRRTPEGGQEEGGIAVDAHNAARAAAAALRFTEAEQIALEGVRRFEPTPANPWRLLTELYLSGGQTDQALSAFGEMMRWNDRQPAALRDQSRAENEAMVALVLMMAGENEQALARIDRALERPDRRGLTTDGAEQARGRHAILRRMIRRAALEERAERASWTGRGAQLVELVSAMPERAEAIADDERIIAVLTDSDRLKDTLRPFVPGSLAGLSPWMIGELIDVLGPAVVSVGLREARRLDAAEPAVNAAYLALEAELAAARGDEDQAIALARRAIPDLEGAGWSLLRARVAAVAAEAAYSSGKYRTANELFATALEVDPGVLRRRGLALPVAFAGRGDEAQEAIDLLSRSPRFDEEDGAFVVAVSASDVALRACLRTPTGNELRCAEVRKELGEDAPEEDAELSVAQRLAREAHRQFFSAHIELSSIDMRSLDGRTNGGSRVANERLRELMQD